jgi:cytochrome c peroxidase
MFQITPFNPDRNSVFLTSCSRSRFRKRLKLTPHAAAVFLLLTLIIPALSAAQPETDPPQSSSRLPLDTLPEELIPSNLPSGLGNLTLPAGLQSDRVLLGRKLFFDGRLSEDGSISCATCHQPEYGFASPEPLALGIQNRVGKRNAPTLFNRGWGTTFFWDGRAISLEQQSLLPISNPEEMGSDLDLIIQRLNHLPEYRLLFQQAFELDSESTSETELEAITHAADQPLAVTAERIGQALADFQRTLILGNSEIDRFRASEFPEISLEARQGLWIFESRGRCWQCHSGANFSDEGFHNTGVGFGQADRDPGRFEATAIEADRFRFKTPTLRGVALTPPYMHDGSMATLEEVVEFYSQGGSSGDPALDPLMKPLNLTVAEKAYLVEFLKALSR